MATQVNNPAPRKLNLGQADVHYVDLTLITSGTTVTYTFPIGLNVIGTVFFNKTTGALTPGGTYTPSTGVYVSPTMAVNDNAVCGIIVAS